MLWMKFHEIVSGYRGRLKHLTSHSQFFMPLCKHIIQLHFLPLDQKMLCVLCQTQAIKNTLSYCFSWRHSSWFRTLLKAGEVFVSFMSFYILLNTIKSQTVVTVHTVKRTSKLQNTRMTQVVIPTECDKSSMSWLLTQRISDWCGWSIKCSVGIEMRNFHR